MLPSAEVPPQVVRPSLDLAPVVELADIPESIENPAVKLYLHPPMALANIFTFWAEELNVRAPDISILIDAGRDQEMWPPTMAQLVDGYGIGQVGWAAEFPVSAAELAQLAQEMPTLRLLEIPIVLDALAVVVHRDNPLEQLTFAQIDALYGKERRAGHPPILTWGDLGVRGPLQDAVPVAWAREMTTGTGIFFRRSVLGKDMYAAGVVTAPGTSRILAAVGEDPAAIACVGAGFASQNTSVKMLAVVADPAVNPVGVAPTAAAIENGSYSLRRIIWLRLPFTAGGGLSSAQRALVQVAMSSVGQEIVVKDGYQAIPGVWARASLAWVDQLAGLP